MTTSTRKHTGSVVQTEPTADMVVRLPFALLDYSPTNPRKSFDARELRELAASIKSIGLLQPVTVRPKTDGRYEVIAGERRTRAHALAKLDTVPAIVREMADCEVLTAQTIENLQRADLAPLDEAEGFAALLAQDDPPITVAELATRVGKSAAYVRSRVQLMHLIDEAKTALRKNVLSLRVALHIARLTDTDQRDILPWTLETDWSGHRPSEGQVAREIERRYFLDLARAPFDTKDASLVEGRPACVDCPLRTGFDRSLFPDIKEKDTCTDGACFHAKRDTFVDRAVLVQLEKALSRGQDPTTVVRVSSAYGPPTTVGQRGPHQSGEPENAPLLTRNKYVTVSRGENCEHTQQGVVVDGLEAGRTIRICANPECSTHRSFDVRQSDTADYRAQERERTKKIKRERIVLRRVLDATVTAIPLGQGVTLDLTDLRLVATSILSRLWHEHVKQIAKAREIEPQTSQYGGRDYTGALRKRIETLDAPEILRLMVEMALIGEACPSTYGTEKPKRLLDLAKRVGVNVGSIRAEVTEASKGKGTAKKARRTLRRETADV